MFAAKLARALFAFLISAALAPGVSLAQPFPSKPIRIVLGYSPGGGMDNLARLYSPKLQELLGTPIIIENRPGATELLAAQFVQNSAPDGYTLWIGSGGALAQGPGVRTDLPYHPLKNFTPVALVAEMEAVVLVRSALPIHTMGELVSYAKANPGKVNYASAGIGSANHLTIEYLMAKAGGSMTHVPYKGDADAIRDLMGGNVDIIMTPAQTAVAFVKDGKLRPIAVTGSQRLKALPEVPTIAESGVPELKTAVDSYTFYGLMGPKGMPPAVVQRINEAFNKVGAMPEVANWLRDVSLRPYNVSPTALSEYIDKNLTNYQLLRGKVKVGTS